MTRDEFLAFLARAASDPNIRLTEDEAAGLLAAFDRGEIDTTHLPLPLSAAVRGVTREDLERAAASLLAAGLLRGNRDRARDRLRARYVVEVRAYAAAVAAGDLSVAEWHALSRDTACDNLAEMAVLGAGSAALARPLLPGLHHAAQEQTAYLSRFADGVAAGRLLGMAWSVGAIAARAALYAGAGYGWFFRARESAQGGVGYVVDWVAHDDDRTCQACLAAERNGPYLVGQGPMPGSVCYGGGRCRCRRETRYDPDAYRRLTGR